MIGPANGSAQSAAKLAAKGALEPAMKPVAIASEHELVSRGERTTNRLLDYLTLTKPRIASMVALSAFIGGLLAEGPHADLARVALAAACITVAAAAASVFNQVLERDTDRLMQRTQDRPLPAGRISARDAIFFGAVLAIASIVGLSLAFNLLSALLALASLFAYVAVYTPLKRLSTLNTVIGAVPGAAPPLIGYVALAGTPGPWAWALFAIVFVWQFPHFMAIAWLYRADYARARMRMLPAMPGCERVAARQALVYSLALLPVVLLPGAWGTAGIVYCLGAVVLSLGYVAASARFALHPDEKSARFLLFTSLAYLPLVLSLVLLDPVVGVAALH
jgi:protoheme IX farnesyltransferase